MRQTLTGYQNVRKALVTKLEPHEMELTGAWIFQDGKIHGDVAADRIKWLIRNRLRKLSVTSGSWECTPQPWHPDRLNTQIPLESYAEFGLASSLSEL